MISEPDLDDDTRQAAVYTCALALGTIAPKTAANHLDTLYTWHASHEAPTRTDYLMGWIDGRLRALAGTPAQRRAARRRLVWAARGLHTLGMLHEAVHAILDLLTYAYSYAPRSSTDAARIATALIRQLATDDDTPEAVRRACREYLDDPSGPVARALQQTYVEALGSPFEAGRAPVA